MDARGSQVILGSSQVVVLSPGLMLVMVGKLTGDSRGAGEGTIVHYCQVVSGVRCVFNNGRPGTGNVRPYKDQGRHLPGVFQLMNQATDPDNRDKHRMGIPGFV